MARHYSTLAPDDGGVSIRFSSMRHMPQTVTAGPVSAGVSRRNIFLFPRPVRRAVENDQVARLRAAMVHVAARLRQPLRDGPLRILVQDLALDHELAGASALRPEDQQVHASPAQGVLALDAAAAVHDPLQVRLQKQLRPRLVVSLEALHPVPPNAPGRTSGTHRSASPRPGRRPHRRTTPSAAAAPFAPRSSGAGEPPPRRSGSRCAACRRRPGQSAPDRGRRPRPRSTRRTPTPRPGSAPPPVAPVPRAACSPGRRCGCRDAGSTAPARPVRPPPQSRGCGRVPSRTRSTPPGTARSPATVGRPRARGQLRAPLR